MVLVSLTACILFCMLNRMGQFDWTLNIKGGKYDHPLWPLLLPVLFGIVILGCVVILEKIKPAAWVLSEIGKCSMIIMYIHQPWRNGVLIPLLGEHYSMGIYILSSVLISYGIYWGAGRSRVLKALFVG